MAVEIFTIKGKNDNRSEIDEIQFVSILEIVRKRNKILWKFLCKVYDDISPNNEYTSNIKRKW